MLSLTPLIASLIHGIILGCLYAVISIGMNLIYGILGAKNIAHGDFVMLGMFTAYWLMTLYNIDPFLTIPITFLIFLPIGFIYTRLISKTLGDMTGSILVTFGLSTVLMNMARVIWGADFRSPNVPSTIISFGFISISNLYLLIFIVAVVLTIALHIFLTKSKIGTAIRAVGQDAEAASSLGIHIKWIRTLTVGIAIGLAGMCGSLFVLIYYTHPYVGVTITLTALMMCVVGGLGSVKGAFIGSLIIGIAQNLSGAFIPFGLAPVVSFLIFLLILIVRPKGLFGV